MQFRTRTCHLQSEMEVIIHLLRHSTTTLPLLSPACINQTYYVEGKESLELTSFRNHWQKAGEIHSRA